MADTFKSLLDNLAYPTKLLKVETSADEMYAIVPKGTQVPKKVLNWTLRDLEEYLAKLQYKTRPLASDFETLKALARRAPTGLEDDFVILRALEPTDPQPGRLEWLNKSPHPKDLVIAGRPFLRVVPPEPSHPGLSVLGRPLPAKDDIPVPDPIQLELPDGVSLTEDDLVVSTSSGRSVLSGNRLELLPEYEISDTTLPEFREAEFYCPVVVKGDLAGSVNWKVMGNLLVEGHWSAPDIEVHGDAQANSGIQTNMNGVIRIYGNCRSTYIQFTRIGIAGDAFIDTSIVQSEVRVGGNLYCRGNPGIIMGAEIHCFSALVCNKVGADKGRRTRIRIWKHPKAGDEPAKTKIGTLSIGTFMQVYNDIWTQKEDAPYETGATE